MSDDVGVQPGRLNELASALEQLRDVLAANVPTIVSKLNMYWSTGQGTPISLSPLQHAQGQSVGDAAEIRARSNLAIAWEAKANACLPGDMISVPWPAPGKPLDAASAQADAQLLAQADAESGKDPKAARALIEDVTEDLQDHAGDSTFLTAFWSDPQAAGAVTKLASALHAQDGNGTEVLSAADTKILSTFASSLAATCTLPQGEGLTKEQSTALVAAFKSASQSDPWSAAMLLTSGPDGKAYGTGTGAEVLGTVTASLLNAERAGTYTVPMNWKQLLGSNEAMNGEKVNQALARFDPTMALLKLDTSNQAAASYTLSTPDGAAIAHQLMTWQFVHYGNLSYTEQGGLTAFPNFTGPEGPWDHYQVTWPPQTIGSFLDAATATPRDQSPQAKWAAEAAVSIINGTPAPTGQDGVSVPGPIRQALLDTFARYLPDLAASTTGPPADPVSINKGVYTVFVGQNPLSSFLEQLAADPADYSKITAMAGLAMGTSPGLLAKGVSPPGLDDPVQAFAALYGRIGTEASNVGISKARQEDLENQNINSMISLAEAGFGAIPGGGEAMTAAQALAAVTATQIPQFSTDNEALAVANANTKAGQAQLMAVIPLVKGLMKTGALSQPPPADAFKDGKPTDALGNWWRNVGAAETVDGQTLAQWLTTVQVAMGVQHQAMGNS